MTATRRLVGVLLYVSLGVAAPAGADVITDWNTTLLATIATAPPGVGPSRIIDIAVVHIAMHDAVQAIQQRFETYSPGITPASGSVIAAASKAARDVLVNRFPEQTASLDATYQAYLTSSSPHAKRSGRRRRGAGCRGDHPGPRGRWLQPSASAGVLRRHWGRTVAAHGGQRCGTAGSDGRVVSGQYKDLCGRNTRGSFFRVRRPRSPAASTPRNTTR